MLTYRIHRHKETPDKQVNPRDYLRKEHILSRQLERCKLEPNDVVSVKTTKGWTTGVVTDILKDKEKIFWRSGTQPFFIVVSTGVVQHTVPLKKVRK